MRNCVVLLFFLSLTQIAQADLCTKVQSQINIGGTLIDIQSIQSPKIKELYKKILLSAQSYDLTPTCNGSALIQKAFFDKNDNDQYAGVFLVKGDVISRALVGKYKLNGDLMFEASETRPTGLLPEEFNLSNTLLLNPELMPERLPALVGSTLLFNSYETVMIERYSKLITVVADKETTEAIIWTSKYSQ